MESKSRDEYTQVFSEPWNMSDVILLVEGEQFNVHRGILAIWSPVFGRMFAADFKEKNAEDVPLPGKKAEEIRELLLVIYPTIMKPISEMNCYFLLALAEEYQMGKLKEKCEDYLLGMQENNMTCADLLVLSQKYLLERLLSKCVSEMRMLELKEITEHNSYKEISDKNMCDIFIGKVEDLEKELAKEREKIMSLEIELTKSKETVETLQGKCSRSQCQLQEAQRKYQDLQYKSSERWQTAKENVPMVIQLIGQHAMSKRNKPYPRREYGICDNTNECTDLYLKAIWGDEANKKFEDRCTCMSLSNLHSSLDALHKLFAPVAGPRLNIQF